MIDPEDIRKQYEATRVIPDEFINWMGDTNPALSRDTLVLRITKCVEWMKMLHVEAERLRKAHETQARLCEWCDGTRMINARSQPCGCITCRCDHPRGCLGCGAKNCGGDACVFKSTSGHVLYESCPKCEAAQ